MLLVCLTPLQHAAVTALGAMAEVQALPMKRRLIHFFEVMNSVISKMDC